jgi:hypothetical protein
MPGTKTTACTASSHASPAGRNEGGLVNALEKALRTDRGEAWPGAGRARAETAQEAKQKVENRKQKSISASHFPLLIW